MVSWYIIKHTYEYLCHLGCWYCVKCGIAPNTFWSCKMASSWRFLVNTDNGIAWAWRQCIPSKLHEPLAQEYGVTSQKTVILNYPVATSHISSNRFTTQQLSLQSLFLTLSQGVAVLYHCTSSVCSLYCFLTEPNNDLHRSKWRKSVTCHRMRLRDQL